MIYVHTFTTKVLLTKALILVLHESNNEEMQHDVT